MAIKSVIFDADGVMIFPWRFGNHLEAKYGITREMTLPFFTGSFNDCLIGKAKLHSVLPPFLSQWGWESTVENFIETWLRVEDAVDQRVVKVIYALRQAGLYCCLATSQESNRANYMRTEMGFSDLFDRLFFSCDLGCQKPDPAFYQTITGAFGLSAVEILFWDDSPNNVQAARKCGWHAEVYTNFEDFVKRTSLIAGITI